MSWPPTASTVTIRPCRCWPKNKTVTGRLWTYVRDDRPFGGSDPPAAMFFYSRDRGGEHPRRHLSGWVGTLQADAYAGFNDLYDAKRRPGRIIEAACWAHGRRKFFVLADLRQAPLAIEAVRRIDEIFAVEREINGATPEQPTPVVAAGLLAGASGMAIAGADQGMTIYGPLLLAVLAVFGAGRYSLDRLIIDWAHRAFPADESAPHVVIVGAGPCCTDRSLGGEDRTVYQGPVSDSGQPPCHSKPTKTAVITSRSSGTE